MASPRPPRQHPLLYASCALSIVPSDSRVQLGKHCSFRFASTKLRGRVTGPGGSLLGREVASLRASTPRHELPCGVRRVVCFDDESRLPRVQTRVVCVCSNKTVENCLLR
uniref:Uncharacterized protein n=1 Tax=Ixodes ricinus TaxID=34613 RepID=A0A6B0UIZ1_IXORI